MSTQITQTLKLAAKPPGPAGLPLVGDQLALAGNALRFMDSLRANYGDVVAFNPGIKSVALFHPEHIGQVLQQTQTIYRKGSEVNGPAFSRVFGNGLVTSEGDFWRRQRQLAQPAFHAQRIGRYADTMLHYGREMLAGWRDDDVISPYYLMMQVTQRIATKTLFDTDVGHVDIRIRDALDIGLHEIGQELFGMSAMIPPWIETPGRRKFNRAMVDLDQHLNTIIEASRRDPDLDERGDLLAMLMQARDENDQPMSPQQLRDEVMTLYLAGHETTSNTLAWALILLAQNPDVRSRLETELAQVLAGGETGLETLRQLPYTNAVIKETMRLRAPVWSFVRMTNQPVELGGYAIEKDTMIWLSQWVTHRDPRWFPDPEKFDPTRWLDGRDKAIVKYAYFPFGGGPRICIGNAFSELEAALLLTQIAQSFQLELMPGADTQPLPTLTLRPRAGLRMRLTARK